MNHTEDRGIRLNGCIIGVLDNIELLEGNFIKLAEKVLDIAMGGFKNAEKTEYTTILQRSCTQIWRLDHRRNLGTYLGGE